MKSANLTTASPHSSQAKLLSGSDRRVTPRFRVQFRTVMAAHKTLIEHTGSVLDLSLIGCRVEASIPVHQSLVMELRIYVPDLDWPIMVDAAVVQWVDGNTFGLYFVRLRPTQGDRLAWVISRVAEEDKH
jgi:PilZ domain-containing protein